MLFLSLILALAGQPRIGQVSSDVRSGSIVWIAGDGFTGSSVLYDNAVTIKETTADTIKGILNSSPPVKWNNVPAPAQVFSDRIIGASPPIEFNAAYCTAIAVAGPEKTISEAAYVNKPKVFGIAGEEPSHLYYGERYPILGRHLAATNAKPTVWLVNSKDVLPIPCAQLGGRGTGNTRDLDRSTLWVEIPENTPQGNYLLYTFQGENVYGLSAPQLVSIPGTIDPWKEAPIVDVDVKSGQDITTWLAKAITAKASEADPLLLRLPVGVFYLSASLDVPSHVGIIGSGIGATRLVSSADHGDYSIPSQRIPANERGRSGMFRIAGSNVRFADMTIELTHGSVQSAIVAGTGIDRVHFRRVRFENLSADADQNGYTLGTIHRFGLWRYWRFDHCEWRCQTPFDANIGPLNGWKNNGAADNSLLLGGSFESVYGRSSASKFGSFIGRCTLIQGLDVSRSRRGMAFAGPDGCVESVISLCNYDSMLSEVGNGENDLTESRGGCVIKPTESSASSFHLAGDVVDRTRWTALVIDGTGQFQYRLIASSLNGVHKLETPWAIVPDTNSTLLLCQCPTDCTYVWNRFSNAVGGINFYGNSVGNVVTSNWLRDVREGIMLNTNWNSSATKGMGGQSGDGHSVAWWGSYSGNVIDGSAGFHFVAPRTTDDFKTYTHPQIAFQNMARNSYFGDVTNQLWAAEGTEQNVVKAPQFPKTPLIDYISTAYDSSLTGRPYLHKVIDRVTLPRNVWYRTPTNIGNVLIRNHSIDNGMVKDSASLITTNAENN